ncbi:AEC family transporter [Microbaculum marinisediminis]|uniref:AEC family transporter n=1 Tax=Microbaculum marinisediminis TaxID=2931392 RepID=A0AAW5R3V3_9HYPH|nr:AEC family transporter [Microbaculum sp. A6E488]MCT8974092.1 AEC family transporter [Microbaculum sp. A6E488]
MQQVISLAMPFFGLIFLGFLGGKIVKHPAEGLAWLNIFIVYFALPALFFQLLAQTPFEELAQWSFVMTTTFATYCVFVIAFVVGWLVTRGNVQEATIQALVGSYSNIGYMGPGITLAALGPAATVPTALIFCFDNTLLFTLVPLLMALGREDHVGGLSMAIGIVRRIVLHPFILATIAGVLAAYFRFEPPEVINTMLTYLRSAAAPCALFAMGVTVALRPLKRIPRELPVLAFIKLILHPFLVLVFLSFVGDFEPVWVYTAMLMSALPPALNVFVLAQQYNVYIERASSSILLGTIISVFTLTTVLYLVANDMVPADLFP